MHTTRYKSKLCMLKFVRTRIILIVIIVLIVIFTYDHMFHNSLASSVLQDGTTKDDLIPDMSHKAVVNSVRTTPAVLLTVFYECLCADSKSFFKKHLLPAVQKEPKLISTKLIPYGKAKTEVVGPGMYKFTCQHGDIECLGNKFHACVIAEVHDMLTQLQIVTCMISDNFNPEEICRKCCKLFGIPWKPIQTCALGDKGSILLKEHGEITNSLVPKVSFIPTILLNESQDNQAGLLKNLGREICRAFKKMAVVSLECKS